MNRIDRISDRLNMYFHCCNTCVLYSVLHFLMTVLPCSVPKFRIKLSMVYTMTTKVTVTVSCIAYVSVMGQVESDPEYQLIVEANNISAEVDNELGRIESNIDCYRWLTTYVFDCT